MTKRDQSPVTPLAMGTLPFTGRDTELARLRRILAAPTPPDAPDSPRNRMARVGVITGPAGVGKSRLLMEALEVAAVAGRTTELVVASVSTSRLPYGPVDHLLPPLPDDKVAPTTDPTMSVLRRTVGTLLLRSPEGLVIGVDDAPLLDDASAALLDRLATSPRVTLLLTMRASMTCPPAVATLFDRDTVQHLRLDPLGRAETEQLAAAALGGQVDMRLLLDLWSISRGNPLVVRETLDAALRQGLLRRDAQCWRLALRSQGDSVMTTAERLEAGGDFGLPTGEVPPAVSARIAPLSSEERLAMEAVALGEPLEVDLLLGLAPAAAIEKLEHSGLLAAVTDTSHRRREALRLTHTLYVDALRQQMAVMRRRRLTARLAEFVGQRGARRRSDVLRQADWLLSAGARHSSRVLLAAAARATALGDPVAGERFARAAHDAGAGAQGLLAVGEALQVQGRAEHAAQWLDAASDAAPDPATTAGAARRHAEQLLARTATVRAMALHWGLGRLDAAHDVLADAERRLPDGDARGRLGAMRSMSLLFQGRYADALDVATSVMQRADLGPVPRIMAECPAQVLWTIDCRYDRVVASADRAAAMVTEIRDDLPLAPLMMTSIRFFALLGQGRTDAAIDGCRSHFESALDDGHLSRAGYWSFQLGWTLMTAGRLPAAAEALTRATQLMEHGALFGHDASAYAGLARCLALLGDATAARRALAEADRCSDARVGAWHGEMDVTRAWVLAAEGHLREARAVAATTAATEYRAGNRERAAVAADILARLGAPERARALLEPIAADCDGAAVPAMAAAASAAATRDAAALMTAAERLYELSFGLHAADAAARAALLHHRAGDLRHSAEAAATARHLYGGCGDADTPTRREVAAIDPWQSLSARERQVCQLVATGEISNAAVAGQLGIAERTVANHLARSYRKLGVTSRRELAGLLPKVAGDGRLQPNPS